MKLFAMLLAISLMVASYVPPVWAQEAATVTGRVTNAQGQPEAAVLVRIESLSVETTSRADGTYRLVIPGARIRAGQAVSLTASRRSRKGVEPTYIVDGVILSSSRAITLNPGTNLTQNLTLQAEDGPTTETATENQQTRSGEPIPGIDIIVKKKPGGSAIKVTTDKDGKVVIRDLGPGDYQARAPVNTSRSNKKGGPVNTSSSKIKRPGLVITFSGGGKPVSVSTDLAHGNLENIPFTIPPGNKQSITLTLTETATDTATEDQQTRSNDPIPGIDIIVRKQPGGSAIKVTTDTDGKFVFTGLTAGKYQFSVPMPPQSRAPVSTSRSNKKAGLTLNRGIPVVNVEVTLGTEPLAPFEIEVDKDGGTIRGIITSSGIVTRDAANPSK